MNGHDDVSGNPLFSLLRGAGICLTVAALFSLPVPSWAPQIKTAEESDQGGAGKDVATRTRASAGARGGGIDVTLTRSITANPSTTTSSGRPSSVAPASERQPYSPRAVLTRDAEGSTFTWFSSGCVGVQLDQGQYGPVGEEVACVPGEPTPAENTEAEFVKVDEATGSQAAGW